MSDIEKQSNNPKLINTQKKICENKHMHSELSSKKNIKDTLKQPNIASNNKKIVLETLVNITIELGKSKIKIKDFLNFSTGSVFMLNKKTTEPLKIFMNNNFIGLGEIVVLENKYGLRITDLKKSKNTLV